MFGFISKFLLFWLECLKLGGRFAWEVFGKIDGFCVLVATFMLWREKRHQDSWQSVEVLVRKIASLIFLISLAISVMAIAPFIKYEETPKTPDITTRKGTTLEIYYDIVKP
jgi:hypothetical protein